MSAQNKNSKADKLMAVSVAVLHIIEKDGIHGVTHSKVSRLSGVSRAWIYEYIGKDKNAFVECAADAIASHFARSKAQTPETIDQLQKQLDDGVRFLLDTAAKSPVIIKVYFRFRGTSNAVGKVIQKYESQWLRSASQSLIKNLNLEAEESELFVTAALAMRLGLAHQVASSASPARERAKAEKIFSHLHQLLCSFFTGDP